MKVCHLTSVHPWNDTRILYKECLSLAQAGHQVCLIVPHTQCEKLGNVSIINIPPHTGNRLKRITLTAYRLLRMALKQKSDVYHFHDPELIWVGILLKLNGKKVIFDIHENISEQIKMKQWLPFRGIISKLYGIFDWLASELFHLVLAERSYEAIYSRYKASYTVVQNMPNVKLLEKHFIGNRTTLPNNIFYLGNVTNDRCIDTIVKSLTLIHQATPDFEFHCIGDCDQEAISALSEIKGYSEIKGKIFFYGHMPAVEAYTISEKCKVGLSILKPIGNYLYSYSTKIFEYMAVGMPVVTSNFQLYKDVIEKNKCGLCINPLDPSSIADAIQHILNAPQEAQQMGLNGRKAVETEYNWTNEEKKLVDFYKRLGS